MMYSVPTDENVLTAAPLVISVAPKPGELLPELVLRAAAVNSYNKAGNVLSVAGIQWQGNLSVAAKARGR